MDDRFECVRVVTPSALHQAGTAGDHAKGLAQLMNDRGGPDDRGPSGGIPRPHARCRAASGRVYFRLHSTQLLARPGARLGGIVGNEHWGVARAAEGSVESFRVVQCPLGPWTRTIATNIVAATARPPRRPHSDLVTPRL